MEEIVLRHRHGCLMSRISERFPEARIAEWCNYHLDVIDIRIRDTGQARDLIETIRRHVSDHHPDNGNPHSKPDEQPLTILHGPTKDHGIVRAILRCTHDRSQGSDQTIARHGGLLLPPVTYQAGWETYRFIATHPTTLKNVRAELGPKGTVEIQRKRPFTTNLSDHETMLLPSGEILGDLTHKQAHALAAAIEAGYYDVPRRVRHQDIAERLDVPRTTYEEHARKAEGKVIRALAPYLSFRIPHPFDSNAAQDSATATRNPTGG